MDGDSSNGFQSSWTNLSDQFRDLILHIKPMITVAHPSDKEMPDVIEILDDEESNSSEVPSTPGARKRHDPFEGSHAHRSRANNTPVAFAIPIASVNGTPTIHTPQRFNGMKRENGPERSSTPSVASPLTQRPGPFTHSVFAQHAGIGRRFIDLDGIRDFIRQHIRTGIPGLVNHGTYNELCMLAVNPWKGPLETFMKETHEMIRVQLEAILQQNLGQYQQTELFKTSQRFLKEFIDEHEAEQHKDLVGLYHLEAYKSFTVNRAAINEHQARELAALQTARKIIRATVYVERQMRLGQMKKLPADLSMQDKRKQLRKLAEGVKDEQLGKDPFLLEIQVAAYVRGYYMTAGLRFVDSVCLSMHGRFFKNIRDKIFYHLEEKLGILGPDGKPLYCHYPHPGAN